MVGICDTNPLRLRRARDTMGAQQAPVYADVDQMFAEVRPQRVIVTTPDNTHDDIIVKALEAGIDVVTEKPMTTTAAKAAHHGSRARAPAGASTSPSIIATRPPLRASRNCSSGG